MDAALPDPEDYKTLEVVAINPETEIWIGDAEGHFVQREKGTLWTRLLPGKYTVSFGLKNIRYPIELGENGLELHESWFSKNSLSFKP